MKLTDEEKRQQSKREYDLACKDLWDEVNRAMSRGCTGRVGVYLNVSPDIIKGRHIHLELGMERA